MSSMVSCTATIYLYLSRSRIDVGILDEGRARRAVAVRSRPFLRRAGELSVGWAFSTCVGIGSN